MSIFIGVGSFILGYGLGRQVGILVGIEEVRESAEEFYKTAKTALKLRGLVVEVIDPED